MISSHERLAIVNECLYDFAILNKLPPLIISKNRAKTLVQWFDGRINATREEALDSSLKLAFSSYRDISGPSRSIDFRLYSKSGQLSVLHLSNIEQQLASDSSTVNLHVYDTKWHKKSFNFYFIKAP